MDDEDDAEETIDEKWESIKTIIKETKQQLIEKDGSTETFRNTGKRYDKECKIPIEEMKKAKEKWPMKGRRENGEQKYHIKGKKHTKYLRIR
jgi:hypothetical protein